MNRTIPVFAVLAAIALALPASHAQTLTGAQAQKSPQAEVFLAYEKGLIAQGMDGARPHMTPEKLEDLKSMVKTSSFILKYLSYARDWRHTFPGVVSDTAVCPGW